MTAKNLQAKRPRERDGQRSQMKQAKVLTAGEYVPTGSLAFSFGELLVGMHLAREATDEF